MLSNSISKTKKELADCCQLLVSKGKIIYLQDNTIPPVKTAFKITEINSAAYKYLSSGLLAVFPETGG